MNIEATTITLNGAQHDLPTSCTVMELLERLELGEHRVAVEINREIVPRAQHNEHQIHPGDVVEIVHFVGGG